MRTFPPAHRFAAPHEKWSPPDIHVNPRRFFSQSDGKAADTICGVGCRFNCLYIDPA